jgi:transposase
MSKGKRYTQQFKGEAVKQIVERGYSVAEVAERLGISTKTLYHWRASMHGSSQQIKSDDDQAEIARPKAELMRVTEERDILKKAVKYFASQPE